MSAPRPRVWIGCLVVALAAGLVGGSVWISRNWPFTRQAVTQTLQERFARDVVIANFRETWFPPGCVADDVKFLQRANENLPPLITARNIIIRSSWPDMLRRRIGKIKLVGLRITIPPADASGKSPVMPISDNKSKLTAVGEVEANDAILEFLPHTRGGRSETLQIHQLVIDDLAKAHAIPFRVSLKFDRPAGELAIAGKMGPWNSETPGWTPIGGTYQFVNADLGAFHDLRGILSSKGGFDGKLANVAVDGSIDVPNFHVDGSAHSVHFMATYRAQVDGQNADTVFREIKAHVGHTEIIATGNISGGKGSEGKTARLQLTVNRGRVEDLLNYFSEEKHPSMTGAVRLGAYVEIPPGDGFLKKIRLNGGFGVAGGKFTSPSRQEPVNHLSESARGEKKEQQEEDPRTVLSNLRGHVAIRSGVATLTNVAFDFPGASSEMSGTYALIPKMVDLHGTLRTDGAISDTASGFKAVMLKVATPFLKKQHTTVVPFSITGPASHPSIGLDLRHKTKL